MAAAINFYGGENYLIDTDQGSGVSFFGSSGFGASIQVGEWNGRTFISNSNGTSQGAELDNVQYLNAQSGILGQVGTGIALTAIPNAQSTMNIRFTNDTAVQTQNAKFYCYDRYSINNPATGVTFKAAEIAHPDVTQANNGSGDTEWSTLAGTGVVLSLNDSPGVSGLYNNGAGGWSDTVHDYYVVASVSPDNIGSKTQFGGYFSIEYL